MCDKTPYMDINRQKQKTKELGKTADDATSAMEPI